MSSHSWELSLSGSNLELRQMESRWWQGVKHRTQGKIKYAEKTTLFLQVYEGLWILFPVIKLNGEEKKKKIFSILL